MVRFRSAIPLVTIAVASCGPPPPATLDPHAGDDGSARLEALERRRGEIPRLRLGMEMTWQDAELEIEESFTAAASYDPDGKLRIRATTRAFFTVFDLVVDGERVWLDVPRENLTLFGGRDDPAWDDLPLSPDLLTIALLADPEWNTAKGEETAGEGITALRGPDGVLEIEAATGLPRRYVREASGPVEIRWSEWAMRSGITWPHRIELLGDRSRVVVDMGRVQRWPRFSSGAFVLTPEPGREILTPEEGKTRWRRLQTAP